ncbi:hypothetical protein [Microbacterium sp. PA5]|uniref:hypothetical protein n=1 Tax=Microbacterium sp. PA5 TaxID=3416654 RepID=UPI003CF76C77
MSTLDDLLSGGAKTAKFATIGDSVTGKITSIDIRQRTDPKDGSLQTWDDGSPQEQILISVQTGQREDAEDDGVRTIYIKSWGQHIQAFRTAVRDGGKPAVGDTFTATYTGDGEQKNKAFSPPKEFQYTVAKASAVDRLLGDTPDVAPAPVATPPAAAPSEETPAAKAQKLIGLGLDDAQIQQVTGLDPAIIAALRGA